MCGFHHITTQWTIKTNLKPGVSDHYFIHTCITGVQLQVSQYMYMCLQFKVG